MAPDLNSVPVSPRNPPTSSNPPSALSISSSRRASQIYPMNPPPLPLATPGGTIPTSVQQGYQAFPPLSPVLNNTSNSGSESGPSMPMRHPQPMTPAELHLELEKEQEAVVNRLTRELTALRAHSASIASTASSASTFDINSPSHPTASRRHRSSSSTSQPLGIPLNSATANIPHHHHPSHRASLSGATEPNTSTPSAVSRHGSVGAVPLTPRYEDVALHRQEMEEAKRENERLRRRVRELEALVRGRRASSVSTQASASASNSGTESRDRSVSVQRRGPSGTGEEAISRAGSVTGREVLRDALRND